MEYKEQIISLCDADLIKAQKILKSEYIASGFVFLIFTGLIVIAGMVLVQNFKSYTWLVLTLFTVSLSLFFRFIFNLSSLIKEDIQTGQKIVMAGKIEHKYIEVKNTSKEQTSKKFIKIQDRDKRIEIASEFYNNVKEGNVVMVSVLPRSEKVLNIELAKCP